MFVGLDKASEDFKVKECIEGIGGSFLGHIASKTGAKFIPGFGGRGSMKVNGGWSKHKQDLSIYPTLRLYIHSH